MLSEEGKILTKYYWVHRLCRVGKIHKFAELKYKDVEDIAYLARRSSNVELLKIIAGLTNMKQKLVTGIDECIKEMKQLYERRRQSASSS